MNTKILNLSEAYDLYRILKPVFPKTFSSMNLLVFLETFLIKIFETDVNVILDILDLLLEENADKIVEVRPIEILSLLVHAFEKNKLVGLMGFFDGLINDK